MGEQSTDWNAFTKGQPPSHIRPNKLRDLLAAIDLEMSDAAFRLVVMHWLRDVTYAE